MQKSADPYKVLGVASSASDEDIKKAYKDLAKRYHPDRNQGDSAAEEKFKEVKGAFEKIKNAQARQEYENEQFAGQYQSAAGGAGFSGNPFGSSSFGSNPFGGGFGFRSSGGEDIDPDILKDIFGSFGMGGGASSRDELAKINLRFWDAVLGGEQTVSLPGGQALKIKIPVGVKNGQKIRLKGQASKLNPRSSGDLLIEVKILDEPNVAREGNDIILVQDVPVDAAILGGPFLARTPLGNFELKLPEYTNSGQKIRLKGKGIKGGDLYIKVNLSLPRNKHKELVELFRNRAA